jgi:LPXTG-motif cell wall-anchored protein
VVRPSPTPRPSTGLPNTSGGSLPILLGIVLLVLAGAVALARRRLS